MQKDKMVCKCEWIGKWWVPETPEKTCCGVLKYDPIEGSKLELYPDKPVHCRSSNNHKIFYGSAAGQKITLYECDKRYEAKITVIGNRYLREDELKFQNYEVYISYLNNWASDIADEQSVKIDDKLTIILLSEGDERRFKFSYKETKSFNEFKKDLLHLTNFISLAVEEGCYYENVSAYDDQSYTFIIKESRYFGAKQAKLNANGILFSQSDINKGPGFENALQNWYKKDKELLCSFCGLYFVSQYDKNLFDYNFLCLAQALDSLTNYYFDVKWRNNPSMMNYLPQNEFDILKNKIIKSVKNQTHKNCIEEILLNKISFKKRINCILNDLQKILKIKDKDNLATFIANTRHSLSHGGYLCTQDKTVRKGHDLVNLFYGVKMILTCVMMEIIGFDKDFNSMKLRRHWAYVEFFKKDFKF